MVQVYNTEDGKMVDNLKAHKDTVYTVSYSRDGKDPLTSSYTANLPYY